MLQGRGEAAGVAVAAYRLGIAARIVADELRAQLIAAALLARGVERGDSVLADREPLATGVAAAAGVDQLAVLGGLAVVFELADRRGLVGRRRARATAKQRRDDGDDQRPHRRNTPVPANRASSPSWSAMRSSWLYFATR